MKYRIAIQEVEGRTYRHRHNIMLETEDLADVIAKVRCALHKEIRERYEQLADWAYQQQSTSLVKRLLKDTPEDLIDWHAKGHDISREEYLKNEIDLENL